MFFGDRKRFGIECRIYARYGSSKNALATMCLYAGGHRIGDPEQSMVLGNAASFFAQFLKMPPPRHLPGQAARTDAELLADTDSVLWGNGSLSQNEYVELTAEYEHCALCPTGGESFDGELVLLLEEEDYSRLIWREYETGVPMHVHLEAGECEAVLQEFIAWAIASDTDKSSLVHLLPAR